MTITTLPTAPSRSMAPAAFVTAADEFVAALSPFVTELNLAIETINASVAGGGARAVYTFSATTTGPATSGQVRFNNATHMSATQIFLHETPASGSGSANFCGLMDASTSSWRGILKVSEVATPTDYIYFKITNGTDNGTDWTYDVVPLFGSAAAPIGAVSVNLDFWPVGDVGSLAGGVAMTDAAITGVKTATYTQEVNNATTTGAVTVNWTTGALQKQAQPTGIITYTFTQPGSEPCHLQLKIPQGGTAFTPVFPASVKWLGLTWAPAASKTGFVNLFWDGSATYWAMGINEV